MITKSQKRFLGEISVGALLCEQASRYIGIYQQALGNFRVTQEELAGLKNYRDEAVACYTLWKTPDVGDLPSWDRNLT